MIPPNNNGQGQYTSYDPRQQQIYQFSPGSVSTSSSFQLNPPPHPQFLPGPSASPEDSYSFAQLPVGGIPNAGMAFTQQPLGQSQASSSSSSLQINIPPPIPIQPHSRASISSNLLDGDNEPDNSYVSDADAEIEGEFELDPEHSRLPDEIGFPPVPSRRETYGSLSGSTDSMVDGSLDAGEVKEPSNKRKPRITLPRGRACVACRNRKLKCTGDAPCKTCQKAGIECRYEELPRKKPRAMILEERVAELEACLNLRPNDPVPPRFQSYQPTSVPQPVRYAPPPPSSHSVSFESRPQSATSVASPPSSLGNNAANFSLVSHIDITHPMPSLNPSRTDIPPNSALELALVQSVLPFAPFIGLPLHSARFIALLTLPPTDPRRPHPALLYILFAQAVRILELDRPAPRIPSLPPGMFPQSLAPSVSQPNMDRNLILSQVAGTSLILLERARQELDRGIRNVDRTFDLTRAAIGIAWMLYSMGHFIEGWNIPVSRLLISCGLHRITGTYIPPEGGSGMDPDLIPKPYAPSHQYAHSHSVRHPSNPFTNNANFPVVRMRPIIIPPARDEIELAERVATFWAAKMQDWEAGIGWGWTVSLADEICTTEWSWGSGSVEPSSSVSEKFSIRDLYDPSSAVHSTPTLDTTYVLAIKSLALLHRASALYDLPESSYAITLPDGRVGTSTTAPLTSIQSVQVALTNLRQRVPDSFQDYTQYTSPPSEVLYEGLCDPWWIMFHSNLYTAEMLCWRELAEHHPNVYENAVRSARALTNLVRRVPNDSWANLDLVVALNLSLTSRFLFKESSRLLGLPQTNTETNRMAAVIMADAEVLRQALSGTYNRYSPIAGMHSLIVQRVREGWPEKEGEYERI
ncbi:hypothetical protein L486_06916 [Kwoniella mangroviensis CBS 10435]|uniref:Zn(2)-C6 fungal-type domain-containing protein n=1 Tax=Kwoniella mangroviensis CBS 10435 TaxID=1331196 RepID=A0A1B9IIX8_9TREE|nr:hypothetical protein L486_06916 [Kwoniella mangroviensis CBS 10435]